MGGLILGVNTLYMLSCFLKQFALVGKGLIVVIDMGSGEGVMNQSCALKQTVYPAV